MGSLSATCTHIRVLDFLSLHPCRQDQCHPLQGGSPAATSARAAGHCSAPQSWAHPAWTSLPAACPVLQQSQGETWSRVVNSRGYRVVLFQAHNSPEHPAHGKERPTQPWGPSSRDSIPQLCVSCSWKAASITAMAPACHQHALVHTALCACRGRDGLGPALPSLAISKGFGACLSSIRGATRAPSQMGRGLKGTAITAGSLQPSCTVLGGSARGTLQPPLPIRQQLRKCPFGNGERIHFN